MEIEINTAYIDFDSRKIYPKERSTKDYYPVTLWSVIFEVTRLHFDDRFQAFPETLTLVWSGVRHTLTFNKDNVLIEASDRSPQEFADGYFDLEYVLGVDSSVRVSFDKPVSYSTDVITGRNISHLDYIGDKNIRCEYVMVKE